VALSPPANAQQTMTTGDGLLRIQTQMPEEIRLGEQFTYQVTVQNASDNVTLHDIKLKQSKADGFSIESTSMKSDDNSKRTKDNKSTENKSSKEMSEEGQGNKNAKQGSKDEFTVSLLEPGQSQTIEIKAAADKEGQLKSCLQVVSYKPSLCLMSTVVKPELQLTKNAPKQADRCNQIELTYTVKNDGSGDVGTFVITDDLGDGLKTIEGNSTLKFDVDGLPAGETRKFVARVFATKPGEFSSRAVAKAKNSELKSRSEQTTTKVVAADLAVKVEGPGRLYGNKIARFTAFVTNTGNTPAKDVSVDVMWPADASLVDMGDYTVKTMDKQSTMSMQNGQEDKSSKNAKTNSKGDDSKDQNSNMSNDQFTISMLEPGQTATFEYAVRPGSLSEIKTEVKALYVCSVDTAKDSAQAESRAMSSGFAIANIVRLPALQMIVLDDEDPVTGNTNVTYTIRIMNEGDAVDNNVQLTATLPEELKFESAKGPTDHKSEGSTVTFNPIKTLEPGDTVDFKVTAKNNGNGNVQFKATLNSDSLDKGVVGEEPTRLFSKNTGQ
jgi:uncharacterized repeat protein (TIGR01451 family)